MDICFSFYRPHDHDIKWYGSLQVSGGVRSRDLILKELSKFFDSCRSLNLAPLVYYTGNSDLDGDWCFPPYKRITFEDLYNHHRARSSGQQLMVWSDCCYSGRWVVQSRRKTKMIVKSASGPLTTASNNVFSAAIFKNDEGAMKVLQQRGAMQTFYDGKSCNVRDISNENLPSKCICCGRPAKGDGFMCYDGAKCGESQCQASAVKIRCITQHLRV